MLESDAIIKYLFEEYGDGVVSFLPPQQLYNQPSRCQSCHSLSAIQPTNQTVVNQLRDIEQQRSY